MRGARLLRSRWFGGGGNGRVYLCVPWLPFDVAWAHRDTDEAEGSRRGGEADRSGEHSRPEAFTRRGARGACGLGCHQAVSASGDVPVRGVAEREGNEPEGPSERPPDATHQPEHANGGCASNEEAATVDEHKRRQVLGFVWDVERRVGCALEGCESKGSASVVSFDPADGGVAEPARSVEEEDWTVLGHRERMVLASRGRIGRTGRFGGARGGGDPVRVIWTREFRMWSSTDLDRTRRLPDVHS